ncbi:hypothetical protein ACHHYP_04184 [Achlya hypogyna]|uniref:Uncharacterized protein n=1 Tax=Achlya hypogyna TaxID=1202772 RepID=A0A1V9Z1P7_ACHHY|nr:hypothetical protein ACHHYP_04184 [Achlya hypogyna]
MGKEELAAKKARREEHLKTVYASLEALVPTFEEAIATLERHVESNRTPQGVEQWFLLYLRVVDLAVEIRRGEIRHRSSVPVKYKSQTKTCHATATTNGLGIDDANVLINELDKIHKQLKKRKPMHLDMLESQFDILDRDTIGPLDKRLFECKRAMESTRSAYYSSCTITVHGDLHIELVVKDGPTVLLQRRRQCTSIDACECPVDATPWIGFRITESAPQPRREAPKPAEDDAHHSLNDLKKSYGVDVDERERSSEAFQNEVLGLPVAPSVDIEPRVKRRCLPLQQAVQKECASMDAFATPTAHAILAALKPQAASMCSMDFQAIEWPTLAVDKVATVANIAASANLYFSTWNMNDVALKKDEVITLSRHLTHSAAFRNLSEVSVRGLMLMSPDFSVLLPALATLAHLEVLDLSFNTLTAHGEAIEAILQQCSRLRSLNLEQCHLKGLERYLLKSVDASQDHLQTLVLADNNLASSFLASLMQLLPTLALRTLDLRHVVALPPTEGFSFQTLGGLRDLLLDNANVVEDASFVSSLNSALIDDSCALSVLSLQCTSPVPEAIEELLGHVAHYGQIERLSLLGVPHLPSLDLLLRAGLAKCTELDLSLAPASFTAFIRSLAANSLPALKVLRVRVTAPATDAAIDAWRGDVSLHLPHINTVAIRSK